MDSGKSLYERIFSVNNQTFESLAIDLFLFQYRENTLYREYVDRLGIKPSGVQVLSQIPFLPIEFFKTHTIKAGNWKESQYFESSGTTGQITSKHWVADQDFYLTICRNIFEQFYGNLADYTILALLPSYLERSHSSLVSMTHYFIGLSNDQDSGFFLHDQKALFSTLERCRAQKKKTLLLGVTFALLDFVEDYAMSFPELMVMETGGMKGRREELLRSEVHDILKTGFGIKTVHSEYGMTELFSQAYSTGEGVFHCGNSMKVLIRDINDPLTISEAFRSGGLNIIDLANVHTCSFIETKDIGKINSDNSFEVLGRMDNSDIRGCNLMLG